MRAFSELRKDPHRPSVMDPADYVFVGAADDHPDDSYMEIRHDVLARHGIETGSSDRYSSVNVPFYDARTDGRPNYRCHHCGKHGTNIRYFCFFLHKPSKQVIVVGQICAKKLSLGSREELDFQKRAETFRRGQARHEWVENHEEEFNFLKEYSEADFYAEFLDSLWKGLQEYGSLTPRQLEALRKWMARGKPWARVEHKFSCDVSRYGSSATCNCGITSDADRHKGEVTHTDEHPTEAQVTYINQLMNLLQRVVTIPETRIEASNLINALKAECNEKGIILNKASQRQVSFINALMEERQIPLEKRREARAKLDAGLTRDQASAWIERLRELPEIEEGD